MSRKKTNFEESLRMNNFTYRDYINRLSELSISMFEWEGIPDSVDVRYLEMSLFIVGSAVYFEDKELNEQLCLSVSTRGQFDPYGYPKARRAYSRYNNYQMDLTEENSVIIYNNMLRTNTYPVMSMYAKRLYNLDRIIDVNANAQKTPVLIQCDEKERLTLLNLYKEFDGNAPVIFGGKNLDIKDSLKSISTNAPYIADKLYNLKTQYWNEALTYLGISNINTQKKERMITDEVTRNQGGVIASRYSRMNARQQAVDKINRMFGTDIKVRYREDFRELVDVSIPTESEVEENE